MFFIKYVILWSEFRNNFSELIVGIWIIASWSRDNQWSTSFIDQDGVDFIDDGKIELALSEKIYLINHVVAKVVETKFVIGTISNISSIGLFPGTWL